MADPNAGQVQANTNNALVKSSVDAINGAFANRAPQYAQFLNATQGQYNQQLAQQNAIAARNLKFALARGGQTGGSLAADQGAELGRETAAGQLAAAQKAQGALSGLQQQDQSQRLQLISEAQSGADIGNGAITAGNVMQQNLGNANANNQVNGLGDVFGGIANSVNQMNNNNQLIKGYKAAQQYANPYTGSGP